MFSLSSFLDDREKKHPDFVYYIKFKKAYKQKVFFLNDGQTFAKLINILKKYCILQKFNANYEILEFLGSGHFAEVFSVKNKNNNQLFAAKIFQKSSEKIAKNQVLPQKSRNLKFPLEFHNERSQNSEIFT
jgi:serine/threonine protein kinase